MHHNLEVSTCDPFAYNMNNSITGTLANSGDPDEMRHKFRPVTPLNTKWTILSLFYQNVREKTIGMKRVNIT